MVTNKHILFIVENNPYPGDVRVRSEAEAAKSFGHKVTVISPLTKRFPLKYENIDGIAVYRHPMPVDGNSRLHFIFEYINALFWELLLSIKIFIKNPFQIIHGANPPDTIFLIAILFKIFGTKYIFDHHDISPENYLAKFGSKDLFHRFLLLFEKFSFRCADIVISTNQSYKKIAIHRGMKKDNEVFVVRNGPDLSRITFVSPNSKLKSGFKQLVAYIGAIGKQEDIDVLLRVASFMVYDKGIRNIKFIIIGSGPYWDQMVKLSEEMKLTNYVQFTGYIPYREVYEILATADVCVNPEHKNSFTDKSTMIKIMDYMVFAKPIVQFDTTEGRVTAGESSVYVENNDEIAFANTLISLLNNRLERERMGEIGKKRIYELLSWDKQKINLQRAYGYFDSK